MKKVITKGDKREAQLKYRFKELKKAGQLRKPDGSHMSINEFRKSEFNAFATKEVTIVIRKGKETKNITRKVKKYVSLKALTEAKNITFPAAVEEKRHVTKSERREARRHLKHVILKMIQEAAALRKEQKKLNRELRIAHAQERKDLKARQELEKLQYREAA
jgi:hypothetical protein